MILDNEELTEENCIHLISTVNAPHNPVKYLAIDPGKANGICGYDEKFYLAFMHTIREEDMQKYLDCFATLATVIVEDFVLYPNKSKEQIYSDMLTSRVIGRIEGWAARNNIKLVKQPASIKKAGYLWIGKKPLPKSNPQNHKMDAHVHGMYWAIRNKLVDPPL